MRPRRRKSDMKIYLIRHADPDYAHDTITPRGHLEAQALARRMFFLNPDRIYSSPMGRAIRTMQYTAELLKKSHSFERWTAEIHDFYAELEDGKKVVVWDLPGPLFRAKAPVPTQDNWHEIDFLSRPFLRQRFTELCDHSDEFMRRHGYQREGTRYRIIESNRDSIALFCHGGFSVCWLAHLLEIPLPLMISGFGFPPTGVTTIEMDERGDGWAVPRCAGVADVSHLYEARLLAPPK